MAKRKSDGERKKPQHASSQEDKNLQTLYVQMRQQFTAADLQKYTEIEPGIPLEDVIAEMEEIHRQVSQSQRKKA